MTSAPMTPDDAIRVQVAVPADPHHLPLLRRIASALAASCDFDIDTMADLRMAVDELGATALTRARPQGEIRVEYEARGDEIAVAAIVTSDDAQPIDQDAFGWMVLTALTRSTTAKVEAATDGEVKHRIGFIVRPHRPSR